MAWLSWPGMFHVCHAKGGRRADREAGFQRRLEDDFESVFFGTQVPKPLWVFEK